ncbi:hypothetical protein FQN60_015993 [Etheostoma spectabile]|uniref:Uncharacterized protein n=1 Tax=Etheostoma spectabile TaxID=54343 RepID=A0A5J5CNZ2_9PERO|nr:hypothetical protein FQN60_015993 [Etheostoma spectabile]
MTRQGDKVPQNAAQSSQVHFRRERAADALEGDRLPLLLLGADQQRGSFLSQLQEQSCPLKNESCASPPLLPQRNAQLSSLPISPLMSSALPAALSQTLGLPPESRARPTEEDDPLPGTFSY